MNTSLSASGCLVGNVVDFRFSTTTDTYRVLKTVPAQRGRTEKPLVKGDRDALFLLAAPEARVGFCPVADLNLHGKSFPELWQAVSP